MLQIRSFREADIPFALEQTSREGWDSTRASFRALLEHDADGCFVAELGGQPVGLITTTRYRLTGWVGNLIVAPQARRKGLGERLMTTAIQRLESSGVATLRLEADPPGIGIYRRLGFVDEYESPRYRCDSVLAGLSGDRASPVPDDTSDLLELDAKAFGDERGRLLPLVLGSAQAAYRYPDGGPIRGYLAVQASAAGARLGPWVALDSTVAEILLATALHHLRGRSVVVGLPGPNVEGRALLERWGFTPTPSCLRMVRGPTLAPGDPQAVYGLASGAIG
jgi:ribosomal protein S18 acetylase RimI-like enzyme